MIEHGSKDGVRSTAECFTWPIYTLVLYMISSLTFYIIFNLNHLKACTIFVKVHENLAFVRSID